MIIKDYFSDGLLQIAIVLSLLRSDLDSFLDISPRPLPVQSHLFEANDGPLSSITRIDLSFHSREFVRDYPKVLDNYSRRFSPLLRDLHSLSYYRRFDGISTNVHAWLVNEGGSDGCTSGCECSNSDDADDTSTTSQNASSLPVADETSVVVSEPNPMNVFFEDELSKEDMELINILYLQDIDLGVGHKAFDDLCSNSVTVSAVEQKEHESNQTLLNKDNECDCDNTASISSAQLPPSTDSCPAVNSSPQYVLDTETGELVLASCSTGSCDSADNHHGQPSSLQSNPDSAAAAENTLTCGNVDVQLDDHSHTDHQQTYDRQSSYDERWEDMMSVLDLQSVLETDSSAYVDTEWDNFTSQNNASSSLALMHNVSMTQPIASSAAILSPTDLAAGMSMPPLMSYDLAPVSNDTSLPFFQSGEFDMPTTADFAMAHVNLTCETPLVTSSSSKDTISGNIAVDNYMYDMFDNAVPSHSAASNDFNYSTTLSTTLEHFSSASAALNHDYTPTHVNATDGRLFDSEVVSPPSSTNLSDTNALFQQLLRANFLLDELDYGNGSFLDNNVPTYDSWSSSDSAVSSMHSPTLESTVDVPTGASGFADDMPQKHSDVAASVSADDKVREFDRSVRLSASNTSASNSSFSDRRSSTSSDVDQKNVEHNHTYPLTPGQRRRREQEDKDERATRSRDEKKAKDMHIPLTMEEMIDSTVEQFNELLSKHKLSDAQYQLIRDIRRRGKNKLAAQNCRKRKLEVIQTVEDELLELRRERDKLLHEKSSLDKRTASLKQKLGSLEAELFRRLHNETGQDYDPSRYSVLQTDDGRVFIVSRDSSATHDEPNKRRKRKPDKKD